MAERVAALGGSVHADRQSAHRWQVTVRLPLDPAAAAGVDAPV
jgi:signal transduction histidine kinase